LHLESLEYFKKIAEMKSISRVANFSHLSQSALSQQMQKLEEDLGFKLLHRSNKGVELTDNGRLVLKYFDNILRTYYKMMEELDNQRNNREVIKIEADSNFATYRLPCALVKMKELFPYQNYKLISNFSDHIEEDVINDICEIGFIRYPAENSSLYSYEVINEKVVFSAPSDYPIPDKIRLEEIAKYPLIILRGDCIIKYNLQNGLSDISLNMNDLNIVLELESTEAVKAVVLKGYGMGFFPLDSIKKEIAEGKLKIVEINNLKLEYNIHLISKQDSELKENVLDFINGFKNREIISIIRERRITCESAI